MYQTTEQRISIDEMIDSEIAPSLIKGPLSECGAEFVRAANDLGRRPGASALRAWCVPLLFTAMEQSLTNSTDPIQEVNEAFRKLARFLRSAAGAGLDRIDANGTSMNGDGVGARLDVKDQTGQHYGNLFKEFSSRSYWDEPVQLLEQRLVRNGIQLDDIQNKSVLDAGCGGGRYSAAWRLLGARPVVGADVSPINIGDAASRAELANLDGISFREGDVLDLPFGDNEFDIVFSNGVLHHTTDWKKGVSELIRVMKPGGWGWLYLIEEPGGVFWDVIEILRVVMKNEDKAAARAALQQMGMPANRIFYMLDHVMVPINLRLSPDEIQDCLTTCGATDIRRLDRGADIDRIEYLARGEQYAAARFGVGENRLIFAKPR